jgi:DNA-directed RNA polymerase subunit RPC12/RpoP
MSDGGAYCVYLCLKCDKTFVEGDERPEGIPHPFCGGEVILAPKERW